MKRAPLAIDVGIAVPIFKTRLITMFCWQPAIPSWEKGCL
ncbi:hypothetical protein BXY66_3485 [Shimia isoporae]|uniref:Uncharacterized protein n=1 Tax=Shimia isoporae TaxID=647720 RepID=A0A4R1N2U4_9RHOB|nr:hypothetical protein BXY66_3485 [Shimia isoporae]